MLYSVGVESEVVIKCLIPSSAIIREWANTSGTYKRTDGKNFCDGACGFYFSVMDQGQKLRLSCSVFIPEHSSWMSILWRTTWDTNADARENVIGLFPETFRFYSLRPRKVNIQRAPYLFWVSAYGLYRPTFNISTALS